MGEICSECGAAGPWRVRGSQWCGEHKPGVWDPYRGEGMARKVNSEHEAEKPKKPRRPAKAGKAPDAPTVQAPEPTGAPEPTEQIQPDDDAALCFVAPQCAFDELDLQTELDAARAAAAEEALWACARLALGREPSGAHEIVGLEVQTAINGLREELAGMTAELVTLRDERNKISDEWNRTHEQMRATRTDRDAMELDRYELRNDRDRLRAERDALRADLDQLRQAMPGEPDPTTQTEISALRAEVARLQEALTDRAAQVEHLARDLDDQGSAVARWQGAAEEAICVLSRVAVEIGCSLQDLRAAPSRARERMRWYRSRISELQAARG